MKLYFKQAIPFALSITLVSFSSATSADVLTIADLPTSFNDAITIDKKGDLYVSNAGRFSPEGLVGTQVYTTKGSDAGNIWMENLEGPLGNAFDKEGNFYVSNLNSGAIYKRSKHGEISLFSSIVGGGGIAIDKNNEIFVASFAGGAIYKIDKDGNAEIYSDDPLLAGGPVGISFDEHHNLYVGNYNDGKLLKIDKKGNVSQIATLTIAGNHIGYLVYAAGNLYTTSLFTNKIYKVTLDGQVSEFAGSGTFGHKDGPNLEAEFALPNGITTNKDQDTLYVTEYFSSFVKAINIQSNDD